MRSLSAPPVLPMDHCEAAGETRPATLTRLDLASAVQCRTQISRRRSIALVQMVIDEIVETLVRGEDVKLSGFGVFHVRAKAERLGRNPRNGEPARIAPRRVVVFRPSRLVKDQTARASRD